MHLIFTYAHIRSGGKRGIYRKTAIFMQNCDWATNMWTRSIRVEKWSTVLNTSKFCECALFVCFVWFVCCVGILSHGLHVCWVRTGVSCHRRRCWVNLCTRPANTLSLLSLVSPLARSVHVAMWWPPQCTKQPGTGLKTSNGARRWLDVKDKTTVFAAVFGMGFAALCDARPLGHVSPISVPFR